MKEASLMGTSGAARELQKSEQRVRQLADAGTLPSVRDAAGRRLFALTDVLRLKAELAGKFAAKGETLE